MKPGAARTDAGVEAPVFEGRIEVVRTARFCQLGRLSAQTSQVWFACHGYRQLAGRFIGRFTAAFEEGAVVVAPEALSRFYIDPSSGAHGPEARVGASWMTRLDRDAEIRDCVGYLDALAGRILTEAGAGPAGALRREAEPASKSAASGCGAFRPKVIALGFSQGGHAAARWAAHGRTAVDELVLWGSHLPPEKGIAQRLAGLGVTTVFGDRDPVASAAADEEQRRRLAAAGIAQTRHSFQGRHEIDGETVRTLARTFRAPFPLESGAPATGAAVRRPGQNSPTKAISGSST